MPFHTILRIFRRTIRTPSRSIVIFQIMNRLRRLKLCESWKTNGNIFLAHPLKCFLLHSFRFFIFYVNLLCILHRFRLYGCQSSVDAVIGVISLVFISSACHAHHTERCHEKIHVDRWDNGCYVGPEKRSVYPETSVLGFLSFFFVLGSIYRPIKLVSPAWNCLPIL